jgi:hypothetical protein
MTERMDFWRGFAGGLLAGVVIGSFTYFSPRDTDDHPAATFADLDKNRASEKPMPLKREASENAGDPARLLPDTGTISRIDFERPSHTA